MDREEKFILRKAYPEEAPVAAALYTRAAGRPGCTWNEYYPTLEDAEYDIAHGGLYFYETDGRVIGAASVTAENELDELDCWHISDGRHKEISRVVIDETYSGRGLAGKMLTELIGILQSGGCTSVRLLAAVGNKAALATYRKLGFEMLMLHEAYGNVYYACEKIL